MSEILEELDKKSVSRYKSILKKMLTCISKFGSSKEKDDVIRLYHFIDRRTKEIHPVIFLYQAENPWGDTFYPSRLFIVGTDFPIDIDIFNTKINVLKYYITQSSLINVSDFKKEVIDKLKELSIIIDDNEGCSLSLPAISYSKDVEAYVDYLAIKSEDIRQIIKSPKALYNTVDDEAELRNIHSLVSDETQCSITAKSHNSKPLQMFYSIFPLKMDKFEYVRRLKVSDNDVTSIVYCKQTIGNVVIHNFYKYADIWNLIKVDKNV